MATKLQTSFTAGEIAPQMHGRPDMQQYQTGAKTMKNVIVHPQGGASNRPGTKYLHTTLGQCRLIPFEFSVTQAYILVFSEERMQVIKDDAIVVASLRSGTDEWTQSTQQAAAYFLHEDGDSTNLSGIAEPSVVYINGVEATEGVLGSLAVGEWAWGDDSGENGFDSLYVRITGDADPDGEAADYVQMDYLLETPYAFADLATLKYTQSADTLFLVHPDHTPMTLTRTDHDVWVLQANQFSPSNTPPTGVSATESGGTTPTRTISYQIASVNEAGEESLPSTTVTATVDEPWASGQIVSLSWTPEPDAESHAIYKSSRGAFGQIGFVTKDFSKLDLSAETPISGGDRTIYVKANAFDEDDTTYWQSSQLGSGANGVAYIGINFAVAGAQIIRKVRLKQAPAAYGCIDSGILQSWNGATWDSVGTFDVADTPVWTEFSLDTAPAASAQWRLLANDSPYTGRGWGVYELEFYVEGQTNSFIDDNIAPDVAVAPRQLSTPFQDSNPGAVGIFEQRLMFARTDDQPDTVFGSQTGLFENFSISDPLRDSDAIEATIASRQVNEIKHLVPFRDLLVFTAGAEWIMNRGANSDALTPTTLRFDVQSYLGSGDVPPATVGGTVLFVARDGRTVRNLGFNLADDRYIDTNLTILAEHLFRDRQISEWTYQQAPDSILWCVMDDGKLLGLTYIQEHQVVAWHQHETDGSFDSVASLTTSTGGEDVYFSVARKSLPFTEYYIEKLQDRLPADDELQGAWFVDGGLDFEADVVPISSATQADPVVVTTFGAHGYSNGDIVYLSNVPGMTELNGRRFKVANKAAATFELTDEYTDEDIDGTGYTTYTALEFGDSQKTVTTLSGLDHLEGETVAVLADGNALTTTVSSGAITLVHSAYHIIVGLPYTSDLETLSLDLNVEGGTMQNRRRQLQPAYLRVDRSRSFQVGPDEDNLVEMKWRTDEDYDEATRLFTGDKEVEITPEWGRLDGVHLFMRQTEPLPFTVLAIMPGVNIGG